MPFPLKWKKLLEIELDDIKIPDYIFLVYAVCGCEDDSCGWGGWMLEAVFKADPNGKENTVTGDELLSSSSEQICPRCKKVLFRTAAELIFRKSDDQSVIQKLRSNYETDPIEYD